MCKHFISATSEYKFNQHILCENILQLLFEFEISVVVFLSKFKPLHGINEMLNLNISSL